MWTQTTKWGLQRLQDRKGQNPELNLSPGVQPVREAVAVDHSGTAGGLKWGGTSRLGFHAYQSSKLTFPLELSLGTNQEQGWGS